MLRKNKEIQSPEEILNTLMSIAKRYNGENYQQLLVAQNKVHEAYEILLGLKERDEDDITQIEKSLKNGLKTAKNKAKEMDFGYYEKEE